MTDGDSRDVEALDTDLELVPDEALVDPGDDEELPPLALVVGAQDTWAPAVCREVAVAGWDVAFTWSGDRDASDALVEALEQEGAMVATMELDPADFDGAEALVEGLAELGGAELVVTAANGEAVVRTLLAFGDLPPAVVLVVADGDGADALAASLSGAWPDVDSRVVAESTLIDVLVDILEEDGEDGD